MTENPDPPADDAPVVREPEEPVEQPADDEDVDLEPSEPESA